jgi:D-alanine-D-alanine ligase
VTGLAANKLRVLVLTDEGLVPDRPRAKLKGREAELRKTEYDVMGALKRVGHEVDCVGVGSDLGVVGRSIARRRPDIVFNLAEGSAELPFSDHHIVSYLELRRQKYTGCNPRGLIIARDKALTKTVLAYHRIRTPKFAVVPRRRKVGTLRRLRFPLFVKSLSTEGSEAIAQASLVRDSDKLAERIIFVHEKTGSAALVEEFIDGREIYVAVFGNELLSVLPPWELSMRKRAEGEPMIATDRAKWDPRYQKRIGLKSGAAALPPAMATGLERLSKRIYRLLGLSGYARLDYRLDAGGAFYLLEANPNPQIARNEDFAAAAKHAGMPYEELVQKLLTLGLGYRPRG